MSATSKSPERRDGPRIDLRLRVRYSSGTVNGEAEASDVSPKGLRLESEHKVDIGTQMNLAVDVGADADEMVAAGCVMWCRERPSPTGRTVYDVGVAFDSDWLSKDRGPLGQALARLFAMNAYEPARTYNRTPVALAASTGALAQTLIIGDLSIGGMHVKSAQPLGDAIHTDMLVTVAIEAEGKTIAIPGRVAWVAGQHEHTAGPRVADSFGIEFTNLDSGDSALLERVRIGQTDPVRITVRL